MPLDKAILDSDLVLNLELVVQTIKELTFYVKRGETDAVNLRFNTIKETCRKIEEQLEDFEFVMPEDREGEIVTKNDWNGNRNV